MRTLYYDNGKLEIHNNLIIKHKQINDKRFVSYFVLVADGYFYKNLRNMSDEKFTSRYHEYFSNLFLNSRCAKDEIPYDISPIVYLMSKDNGEQKIVFALDDKSKIKVEKFIRNGFHKIDAHPVKKVFIVGEWV